MWQSKALTGLSISKVIGGISKTLNVANQIIPLYLEAKPMIKNAKNAFSVAKEIMATPKEKKTINTSSQLNKQNKQETSQKKEEKILLQKNNNNPVFFL